MNGFLFGPDGNNSEGAGRSPTSLRCLDWKTGEIKWTEPKLGFNGLIAVGGKLLVLTEMGDLVLAEASPDGYKELGSAHVIEGQGLHGPCRSPMGRCMRETPRAMSCAWISAASEVRLRRFAHDRRDRLARARMNRSFCETSTCRRSIGR